MATVRFDSATCRYPGAESPSVTELDLEIDDGEFLVLVGPSGSGKSTALRMLAGLEDTTAGQIRIDDVDITSVAPKDRDIAMVFQNYALYPHMTVAENMGFALKIAKVPARERRERVEEAARMLDLSDYLDRRPKALSGGQRQRVAMGRAIVRSPQVFLMDEPLSNLDAKLRVSTRTQIASLTRRLGVTTVYVTHDQTEAMTMGDRVAVLRDGLLLQVDTPRALYDAPNCEFVAGFIGSPAMNILHLPVTDGAVQIGTARFALSPEQRSALSGDTVSVGVRPEHLVPSADGTGIPVIVELVEELGADAYLYGRLDPEAVPGTRMRVVPPPGDDGDGVDRGDHRGDGPGREAAAGPQAQGAPGAAQIVVRMPGRTDLAAGSTVWLAPDTQRMHLFDTATGRRLPG